MLEINLWDATFSHLETFDGFYSMVHNKRPKKVKYIPKKVKYDGITIFTDRFLNPMCVKAVKSRYKIGWFIERCEIQAAPKLLVDSYINDLDFLMTNDQELLDKYPNRTKFVPFGGTWIREPNYGIHKKNRKVSMIYSNKKDVFPGYCLRHEAAEKFSDVVDLYGNGSPNPIDFKEEGIRDYEFTIVIENLKRKNYFTEKLIDSMIMGSVPIYWGCPNISDYFNLDSIITFDSIFELEEILKNLDLLASEKNFEYIKDNFEIAKRYAITEDWIYENILRSLKDV